MKNKISITINKIFSLLKENKIKYEHSNIESLYDLEIIDIDNDSRKINSYPSIFIAKKGIRNNALDFIDSAKSNGAVLVITDLGRIKNHNINYILVEDINKTEKVLAAEIFRINKLQIIGITGTNGKTTVVNLINHILNYNNKKSASVGTLGIRTKDFSEKLLNTTPDNFTLCKILKNLEIQNFDYAVLEISSHSIEEKRIENLDFFLAGFTNLTLDHLDFHKTIDNYFKTKEKLFIEYNPKNICINIDDEYGAKLFDRLFNKVKNLFSISRSKKADLKILDFELNKHWTKIKLSYQDKEYNLKTKLAGEFNVYNICLAILCCLSAGMGADVPGIDESIIEAASAFEPVPGRFEIISEHPCIIVDYAHTPDALENVLKAVLKIKNSEDRMITVFGCGGDRDKTKRPVMGKIASAYSDITIVTSDNPRTEEPELIIDDILKGIDRTKEFYIQPDRKSAIFSAINKASDNDIILLAGKGHEDYQILKDRVISFSDKEIALQGIKQKCIA